MQSVISIHASPDSFSNRIGLDCKFLVRLSTHVCSSIQEQSVLHHAVFLCEWQIRITKLDILYVELINVMCTGIVADDYQLAPTYTS